MADGSFKAQSTLIAEAFLQTAVFVDDRAFYVADKPNLSSRPSDLVDPDLASGVGPTPMQSGVGPDRRISSERSATVEPDVPDAVRPGRAPKGNVVEEHPLNAKRITDAFAARGLVCAVLCPVAGEDPAIAAIPAASRADILVLDWHLLDTYGDIALEILRKVILRDESLRLRVIAIYTGQGDLEDIAKEARVVVDAAAKDAGRAYITQIIDEFTCKSGPIRVSVFAKPGTRIVPGSSAQGRVVDAESLPRVLIDEFSSMTEGIVSNVALKSLAELRNSTHELLGRVHPSLDAPFLSHRCLLPRPDDAGDHLVTVIADELAGILDGGDLSNQADLAIIRKWIERRRGAPWAFPIKDPKLSLLTDDQVLELLSTGMEDWGGWSSVSGSAARKWKRDIHRQMTRVFCSQDEDSEYLDFEFARLTLMTDARTRQGSSGKRVPGLSLGTVMEIEYDPDGAVGGYWLCIQPRCDSVRVDTTRQFPLLPLQVVDEHGEFSVVAVNVTGVNVRLKPVFKPHLVRMAEFAPSSGERRVIGKRVGREYQFESTSGTLYRWLGTLKYAQAQRVANTYAATIARVGLNESEWIRRANSDDA